MSGSKSTPPPTIEDDRAAPVKFPLNREFSRLSALRAKSRENSPRNQTLAANSRSRLTGNFCELTGETIREPGIRRNVPVSLREPRDDAILRLLCGIGVEA
jgi:hypothetical protein